MREGRGEDVIRLKGGCRRSTPHRGLRVAAVRRLAATRIHDQEVKTEERSEERGDFWGKMRGILPPYI